MSGNIFILRNSLTFVTLSLYLATLFLSLMIIYHTHWIYFYLLVTDVSLVVKDKEGFTLL